ncbi:MAG: hypothetical protein IT439_12850 [Phycisphaerales bacterium]|nr:hypothetical protein [Phycisphaerales bacterium]
MSLRSPWTAIRLGAASLTLAAGLATPALAQTWVGDSALCATPRQSLGSLCVDGHEATIWAEGSFLAQLADAFRCAGYDAFGDCGRLIVPLDCELPRIRWTGCDYRLIIDRDGSALVITPLRVRSAPVCDPYPAPRPRIDLHIDLDPWGRRWDDRHDDWRDDHWRDRDEWRRDDDRRRDDRDWRADRDDRLGWQEFDNRDESGRGNDRGNDRGEPRVDGRTSGPGPDFSDGVEWRSLGRDESGRGLDSFDRRGTDVDRSRARADDRRARQDEQRGTDRDENRAPRRSARLPDFSPGRDAAPSRIDRAENLLRRGEQTGSRPDGGRAESRDGGGARSGFRQSSLDGFDRNLNDTGFGAERSSAGFQPAGYSTTEFSSAEFNAAPSRSIDRSALPERESGFVRASVGEPGAWQEIGWDGRRGRDRGDDWGRGGWDRGHDGDYGRGYDRGYDRDWHDSSWGRSRTSVSFNYGWGGSRAPIYCAPSYPVYRAPTYCAPTYSYCRTPVYCPPTYCPPTYCAPSYSTWCAPTCGYSFTFSTGGWSGRGWGCR